MSATENSRPATWLLKPCLLLLMLAFLHLEGSASHFRHGSITWSRVSETATHVTVQLQVTTSWSSSASTGWTFNISGGNGGSVYVPFSTTYNGQWFTSVGTATTTLVKTATLTTIRSTGCCKISTTQNNPDGGWDIYTVINTAAPGSGPVSTMPAIVNMAIGQSAATYNVPAADPDAGSTLTFGTPAFTGNLANQSNPAGFSISPTGTITFNTVGKTAGQEFNALISVTDNDGNFLLIDFMLRMTAPSTAPIFDYSVTPAHGTQYNLIVGQALSFVVRANDPDAGSTVSYTVSGMPAYITSSNFTNSPLPATGNPAQTTFSYTPLAAHVGNVIVLNFTATDNVGVQANTSVTISISAQPAPVFISPTSFDNVLTIATGAAHQVAITAQSPLGSNVSIAFVSGAPAGVSFSPAIPTAGADPGTTTLNWTPTPAQFGVHSINVQATIASTPTIFTTHNFIRIVNTDPVFTSTPPTTAVAGQLYTYSIVITDPDIAYGDVIVFGGSIPAWATLTQINNTTATLSGTPTVADLGDYIVHLDAEDTYHGMDHVHQNFTISVAHPDSDGDGINDDVDSCPYVFGEAGDACDDGDATTMSDVLTEACICAGVPYVIVSARALLSGPWNSTSGAMNSTLRHSEAPNNTLIPATHPYTAAPWNHWGTAAVDPAIFDAVDGDGAYRIVDWVLLELRGVGTTDAVVASRAALIQRDGTIVDIDGTSPVVFEDREPGAYHIAVRHRNHLGVMTAAAIMLDHALATIVNFSDTLTATHGTAAQRMKDNRMMLWQGNTSGDHRVRYSGSGNDRDPIIQQIYQIPGASPTTVVLDTYSRNDVNLDGVVKYAGSGNDRDPVLGTIGGLLSTATRTEQLP